MTEHSSTTSAPRPLIHRAFWPGLLFFLALFLRTSGLSHDLHLGNVYHADTPKQMRAVERFLDDRFSRQYYRVHGIPDLDGYPYFNSHLVEHIFRGYSVLRNAARWQVGIPPERFTPGIYSIYWVTRILNSLLSALAVVLVYLMGRRHFGPGAGLAGGLLLAFSPVDITTSNYAMSDSTAAFFAVLAVYFALRIVESPRISFYALGGLAAAFAFSAKYHAGMALIPLGAAHLLAFPRPRSWIGPGFLSRGGLLLVFFVLGVFISTPSLLVYPSGAYKDIRDFMEWTANFGMTAEMRELPLWSRFILAMRINLPLLADYLGWIPAAAAVAGMWLFRKRKEFWALFSLPLFFVFFGLTSKPLSHPDYFTVVIPLILLAGAAVLVPSWSAARGRTARRLLGGGLLVASVFYLANYAWNEIFFFRHNDTRRVAESWALDTLPRRLRLFTGAYTFDRTPWDDVDEPAAGPVYVLSARNPEDPPGVEVLHRVSFEQEKLSRMRNWDIRFLLPENDFLRPGFSPPVLARNPAGRRDNIIPARAPLLTRSPMVWEVSHLDRVRAVIVSESPIRECAVILHNDAYPAEVTVRFGGRSRRVTLQPHEKKVVRWEGPGTIPLSRNTNHFYGLRIESRFNLSPVRVVLAPSPLDIARETHLAGRHGRALEYFRRLESSELNFSERAAMAVSGLAGGGLRPADVGSILDPDGSEDPRLFLDRELESFDDEWFFEEFGVHPLVFDWISESENPVDPVEAVRDQVRLLRALISEDPAGRELRPAFWPVLLQRGRALEEGGDHTGALAFYKAALSLEEDSRRVYQALEGLIPSLPDSAEEIRQLIEPYRTRRQRPALPLDIRFSNGLGIRGATINSGRLTTGEHFNLWLDWEVPELDPALYMLEYRILLVNLEEDVVMHSGTYHFVRTALAQPAPDPLRPRSHYAVYLDESYPPGRYAVRLKLRVPAHDRTLRITRPRPARGKTAELARIVLSGR